MVLGKADEASRTSWLSHSGSKKTLVIMSRRHHRGCSSRGRSKGDLALRLGFRFPLPCLAHGLTLRSERVEATREISRCHRKGVS